MFEEGVDYEGCTLSTPFNSKRPDGKQQELQDYAITIDMAKQLAMMVRSERGWTQSETFMIPKPDGTKKAVMHTKWTQKGRLGLYELLKQNGILPLIEK